MRIESTTSRVYSYTLCRCATTGLESFSKYIEASSYIWVPTVIYLAVQQVIFTCTSNYMMTWGKKYFFLDVYIMYLSDSFIIRTTLPYIPYPTFTNTYIHRNLKYISSKSKTILKLLTFQTIRISFSFRFIYYIHTYI